MKYARISFATIVLACIGGAFSPIYSKHKSHLSDPIYFTAEERQAGLDRPIPAIEFAHLQINDALAKLQEISGVRITMRWDSLRKVDVFPEQTVSISRPQGALDEALVDFVEQLGSGVGYEPVKGRIVVAAQSDLPQTMHVYDIRELLSTIVSDLPEGRQTPELIYAVLRQSEDPLTHRDLDSRRGPRPWLFDNDTMYEFSGRLTVIQTADDHRQLQRLLGAIATAKPDGTGPNIEGNRTPPDSTVTIPTVLRVYDVRDLITLGEYRPDPSLRRRGSTSWRHTGIDGLEFMVMDNVLPSSWWYMCGWPGDMYSIGGRLIVIQTPENQKKVAEFLGRLRAGRK